MTRKHLEIDSEKELLSRTRQGDQQAMREIVERNSRQVARTVMGMLGNSPEAEDIGQEVFIQFFKALPGFRGEAKISTYLTRIALNLAINELRRRKRERQSQEEAIVQSEAYSVTPSEKARDLKKLVRQALLKLDPPFRQVVVLRLVNGYSTQEVAEILKLPTGTVLSRLARAQQKLRVILISMMGKNNENKTF